MSTAKTGTEPNRTVAALLGIGLLIGTLSLALSLDHLPLIGAGPEYQAEFSDTAGLQVGEEVRVAGVKVGKVTDIDLAGDRVIVGFQVKNQRLGRATRASIEIKTLLGQHYLAVTPDGPGELPAGYTIPLDRTSTPVQIVPTVQRLVRIGDAIDKTKLVTALTTLSEIFRSTRPDVRGTLDGLTSLSRTISTRDEQIGELLTRANSVTGTLASRNTRISQLITATNQVLTVIDRRRDTIRELLSSVELLSRQVSGVVGDNDARIGTTLRRLGEVIEILRRNQNNLDTLLIQVPAYFRLANNAAGTGPWLDADLTFPRGFALCLPTGPNPAAGVASLLGDVDRAAGGTSAPCLPLGPAPDSTPRARGGR